MFFFNYSFYFTDWVYILLPILSLFFLFSLFLFRKFKYTYKTILLRFVNHGTSSLSKEERLIINKKTFLDIFYFSSLIFFCLLCFNFLYEVKSNFYSIDYNNSSSLETIKHCKSFSSCDDYLSKVLIDDNISLLEFDIIKEKIKKQNDFLSLQDSLLKKEEFFKNIR